MSRPPGQPPAGHRAIGQRHRTRPGDQLQLHAAQKSARRIGTGELEGHEPRLLAPDPGAERDIEDPVDPGVGMQHESAADAPGAVGEPSRVAAGCRQQQQMRRGGAVRREHDLLRAHPESRPRATAQQRRDPVGGVVLERHDPDARQHPPISSSPPPRVRRSAASTGPSPRSPPMIWGRSRSARRCAAPRSRPPRSTRW